mgnify:FL=1
MKSNDKCVIVRKQDVEKELAAQPKQGKTVLEPFRTFAREHGLPFNILEDSNTVNSAEIHKDKGDLWYCLEGEAVFTYGGNLFEPRVKENKDGTRDETELLAEKISGGTEVVLKPGDWLWIPAGAAHSHRSDGVARFVVIKIPCQSGN